MRSVFNFVLIAGSYLVVVAGYSRRLQGQRGGYVYCSDCCNANPSNAVDDIASAGNINKANTTKQTRYMLVAAAATATLTTTAFVARFVVDAGNEKTG